MSILRHFNKHHGYDVHGKHTPFGGGGGFISDIGNSISDAVSGIGSSLASIDPGPMLGKQLAGIDKFVGNEIPGGWTTVGALGAGGLGMVFAPEIAAGLESAGLSSQASSLTPEMVNFANASADPIGTVAAISNMTPEEFAAATQTIGSAGSASGLTAGQDLAQLMAAHPGLSAQQLQDIMAINYGTDPMLSADAANLASQGYDANTINQVLGYSYTPTELTGTGITSNALDAASSSGLSDTLKNINRARSLSNLLGGNQSQIQYKNVPTAQQWNTQAIQNLASVPQQQFGGLYEMNKNPFTFQNPIASILMNQNSKTPSGLNVSGQTGPTLNTTQQNQIFSSLLRSA